MGFTIAYSTEHPADPPCWLDYVGLSTVSAFLLLTVLIAVSTVVFALQKRSDILLKAPAALLLMFFGAAMQISATTVSYLPIPELQALAIQACVLYDYWITLLFGAALWCIGYSISLTNNTLGCMDIMGEQLHSRLRSMSAAAPPIGPSLPPSAEAQEPGFAPARGGSFLHTVAAAGGEAPLPYMPVDDGSSYSPFLDEEPGTSPPAIDDATEVVDLEAAPIPPTWGSEALMWSRGNRLLQRFGCTWRFGVPSFGRTTKPSSKLQGMTLGFIAAYASIALALCICAQYMHASQPHQGANKSVWVCESSLAFKFAATMAMVSFVALSWAQLWILRYSKSNKKLGHLSLVPQFCSADYLKMMVMLTAVFVVTAVINVFGATRYYWGRFFYLELVLALYLLAYYGMCGRVWKDVLRGHRLSDDQISWQLGEFTIPKSFHDILNDPLQREFMYRDFSKWMVHVAQPAFVPVSLRLGTPESARHECWVGTEMMPLHGSSPAVADTHFLVFPNKLLLLFEATARYMRTERSADGSLAGGEEVLPARLTQDHRRNIPADQFDRLARDMDEERCAHGFSGWLRRTRNRLLAMCRRRPDDRPYRPERFERAGHASDTIAQHFLHTQLSHMEQAEYARHIASKPNDHAQLVFVSKALPTLSCSDDWFNNQLMDAHAQESPEFFRGVFQYLCELFDRYYFPQFMKHERVVTKIADITRTRTALEDAAHDEAVAEAQNPFVLDGEDGGLDRPCKYDTLPRPRFGRLSESDDGDNDIPELDLDGGSGGFGALSDDNGIVVEDDVL